MSITSLNLRQGSHQGSAPVPWTTVAVLAVLMSFADGFILISILGAVGAIERAQAPFASWLRISILMLPVFVLAVLGGLAFARNRFGPVLRAPRTVVAAALLIAAAGSVVGTAEVVASAVYDYHLQSEELRSTVAIHVHAVADPQLIDPSACTGVCAAQRDQLVVDEKAARLGSAGILGVNVLLVGWVVAARGGRLTSRRPELEVPTHV